MASLPWLLPRPASAVGNYLPLANAAIRPGKRAAAECLSDSAPHFVALGDWRSKRYGHLAQVADLANSREVRPATAAFVIPVAAKRHGHSTSRHALIGPWPQAQTGDLLKSIFHADAGRRQRIRVLAIHSCDSLLSVQERVAL